VHLALAPKSNAAYMALDLASADVRTRPVGEVPKHLRDAHYKGASSLGHGKGYRYPHDHPQGWVDQPYLPDELSDVSYYRPTGNGAEGRLVARWRERKGELVPGPSDTPPVPGTAVDSTGEQSRDPDGTVPPSASDNDKTAEP
jgi:putative ATPase